MIYTIGNLSNSVVGYTIKLSTKKTGIAGLYNRILCCNYFTFLTIAENASG